MWKNTNIIHFMIDSPSAVQERRETVISRMKISFEYQKNYYIILSL